MLKLVLRLTCALAFSGILFGCGGEEAPPAAAAPEVAAPAKPAPAETATGLGGRVWQVTELDGAAPNLPADARPLTIQFDTAANTANGFAGCNTFRGSYKEGNGAIHLGPFAVTRMACPGTGNVEQHYLGAMAQIRTYRVSATSLDLIDGGGAVLVRYAPQGS